MKKFVAFILVGLMIVGICGCQKKVVEEPEKISLTVSQYSDTGYYEVEEFTVTGDEVDELEGELERLEYSVMDVCNPEFVFVLTFVGSYGNAYTYNLTMDYYVCTEKGSAKLSDKIIDFVEKIFEAHAENIKERVFEQEEVIIELNPLAFVDIYENDYTGVENFIHDSLIVELVDFSEKPITYHIYTLDNVYIGDYVISLLNDEGTIEIDNYITNLSQEVEDISDDFLQKIKCGKYVIEITRTVTVPYTPSDKCN